MTSSVRIIASFADRLAFVVPWAIIALLFMLVGASAASDGMPS